MKQNQKNKLKKQLLNSIIKQKIIKKSLPYRPTNKIKKIDNVSFKTACLFFYLFTKYKKLATINRDKFEKPFTNIKQQIKNLPENVLIIFKRRLMLKKKLTEQHLSVKKKKLPSYVNFGIHAKKPLPLFYDILVIHVNKHKKNKKSTVLTKLTEIYNNRKDYRDSRVSSNRITGHKFGDLFFKNLRIYTYMYRRFFGMGKSTSKKATTILGYSIKDTCKRIIKITKFRKKMEYIVKLNFFDFFLRRKILGKLLFKQLLRTRQGRRLRQGLPCRGQRTKSNAGTPARMRLSGRFLPFALNMRKIREAKQKRLDRRQQRAERRERRRIARLQKKDKITIDI